MAFVKAQRSAKKARVALLGPAGSGKTYSALQIARGLGGRVALIDTENHSAELYSDLLDFDVSCLEHFSPQSYIEAMDEAAAAGYSVLVIDSLSHAWVGRGGVLEMADNAKARSKGGNGFASWREVTPEHNRLVDALVRSPMHLVVTMRTKVEYVQEKDDRGRSVVRKVGLQPVQREGLDYEFDVVCDMDDLHRAVVTKTRCHALDGQVFTKPGPELGRTIRDWLLSAPKTPAGPVAAVAPALDEETKRVGAKALDRIVAAMGVARDDAKTVLRARLDKLGLAMDAAGMEAALADLEAEWVACGLVSIAVDRALLAAPAMPPAAAVAPVQEVDAETKKVGGAALDELMEAMEVDRKEALRFLTQKAKDLGLKLDAAGIVETMRVMRQEWAE